MPIERIHELHAAAISLGLGPNQAVLLEGLPRAFVASLPDLPHGAPQERLLLTLMRLREVGMLGDGTVPIVVWLKNAACLTSDDAAFTDALDELSRTDAPTATSLRGAPLRAPGGDGSVAATLRALYAERALRAASGKPAGDILAEIRRLRGEQLDRADLAPGDHLSSGRFELLEQLGRGGVGTVWMATDHVRGEIVAVKVLHAHLGSDALLRFRRGARSMAKLAHRHVVRVVQAEGLEELAQRSCWFFVMDYLPGRTLHHGVLARQWTPHEVLLRIIEAGAGLHAAHRRGMVHRDVSPDNILIDAEGAALLTDFDLVRTVDDTGLTARGETFGKLLYLAPELHRGAHGADARADVYALGMTAVFALYGAELPVLAVRAPERIVADLDCAEAVRDVLLQAIALSPDDRYENAGEMCGELYQCMKSSPPPVRVEPSRAAAGGPSVPDPRRAELSSCRVFFTALDRVTYSQAAWTAAEVDEIATDLRRRLKLLGLIKGHILVPASHLLESDLAREIILAHPSLITSGILIPTLRADTASCEAFLEEKLADPDVEEAKQYVGSQQREVAKLIDREARVERWDAAATSAWYKARLLADVDDDRSLLRSALRSAGFTLPPDLRARLADAPTLSRGATYRIAKGVNNVRLWETLCTYADFVYYLGGARSVRSEGVLPQENLVDFSKHELLGRRTRLSEMEVFFKVFVDIVKSATAAHFPADLLDAVTVEDVVALHPTAISRRFVEAYDHIQKKTKEGLTLQDPDKLVLLMEELDAFERDLHKNLDETVRRELSLRRPRRAASTAPSACSLASLLVPYHEGTTPRDLVISDLRVAPVDHIAAALHTRIHEGLQTCRTLAEQRGSVGDPVLLPFVEKLKVRYAERLSGQKK